jgi:hypothetical protein
MNAAANIDVSFENTTLAFSLEALLLQNKDPVIVSSVKFYCFLK